MARHTKAPPAVEGVGRWRKGAPYAAGRGSAAQAGLNALHRSEPYALMASSRCSSRHVVSLR